MWPSLAIASRVSDIANIVLVCSLVAGVVSTALIVWMGNVKESYWDDARHQSNQKIRELDVAVAEANARAAEANEKAEHEKLARARIEAKLTPRTLDPAEQQTIAARMAPFALAGSGKQRVAVFASSSSFESGHLADEISATLVQAGWDINRYPVTYGLAIGGVSGIGILTSSNRRSIVVGKALAAALNDEGITAGLLDSKFTMCEELGYSQEKADADPACSAISVIVGDHP